MRAPLPMPDSRAPIWEEAARWPFCAPDPSAIALWGGAEWREAKQAALIHGIAPLLGASPEVERAFAAAPEEFRAYLASQAALNAARVARMRGELNSILERAREAGLEVLPLKGAAILLAELLPVEQRPLNDLDFLVRPPGREPFEAILQALDYRLSAESPRHREFKCHRFSTEVAFREGEHPENPILVEVHTWAGQEMFSALRADITAPLWAHGKAPRGLLLHLAVHAGANAAKRRLRLIQLIDLARLAPAMVEDDWVWLRDAAQAAQAGALAATSLRLAERFAGLRVPPAAIPPAPHGLDALLDNAPLHEFTPLAGPLSLAWELQWLPPAARWRMRLRRAVPLHRLALDPVRLRERYGLPLDAHPARAYAIHFARAAAWPAIVLLRTLRGAQ